MNEPQLKHVVLDELATSSEHLNLDDITRQALQQTKLVTVVPAPANRWMMLPNGYVGAVQFGELLVEVRPKERVGVSQLLFLLSYAKDPGFRPENVEASSTNDLWPAMGETFARLSEQAIAQGVLHGYRSVDDSERTLRGRIRMSDQLARHPGMMFPLEVTYDEFTTDIPENRILKAATYRLLLLPGLGADVRQRLERVASRLAEVSPLAAGVGRPAWQPTRRNSRYIPALRIAELVLENLVAEARHGRLRVAAFVVNMAKVFEDFISIALAQALTQFDVAPQTQVGYKLDAPRMDGASRVDIRPDIVLMRDRAPVLALDAKYKAESSSGQHANADYYQMLAYATALGLGHIWLVYAGKGEPLSRRIINSGVCIHEYPLDLSSAPQQVLTRIHDLALTCMRTLNAPHAAAISTA
ncbi:McrBC restriction endonuclease system protein McrC [Glutamicibacter creatinolyticus]|uniref:McrBC restriction endonuclease system protein McrC n=1 Tax=Glutamicibacter creatinolyticus TaxID=162496 RepID=A0A5B7WTP6_9MICC|nr:restriction endonuclease [Glutamicibacter creatinolyticus]QCY46610.1 McrBC restriction endonuclease system protein McrC [Glutamicibacter creatinolyticus]